MDEVEITVKVRIVRPCELSTFFGHPEDVGDHLLDTVTRVVGAVPGIEVVSSGSEIVGRS